MRVMCDTNILVRAALSPAGSASELLRLVALEHVLVTSSVQLVELLDVLRRPSIAALHKLDDHGIRRFITRLYKLAVVVPLPALIPQVVPGDPKDNAIVMTAIAGEAAVLCTLDRHLRIAQVREHCDRQGVRIRTDAELLAELRPPPTTT
jgi:putative PIN family toxin of toxin-antitoxin system